ncbi:MAG: hypothetical protein QOG05_6262 [Streptosporangiaceae bacterium]|jgi:hypothetical protein|nr:hypothetical protein [Streptosporangiaceae bacterium]
MGGTPGVVDALDRGAELPRHRAGRHAPVAHSRMFMTMSWQDATDRTNVATARLNQAR